MSNDYEGHGAQVRETGAIAEVKSFVQSKHGGAVSLVMMQLAIASSLITSCVLKTQPDDKAEEAGTQEEIVPASNALADGVSPEAAVDQRRSPGTPPRVLPGVPSQATAVLAGHTDKVWHAAFSPDGSRIVTSSVDSTARLWDGDGKPLTVLEGNARSVRNAKFSPDGSRIVAVADSADHTVRLWDSDGKQLAVLAGHTMSVRNAEFSPDGSRIVTASVDSTARLWDSDGKPLAVLAGHTQPVRSAEFSSDGRRIVTTSADGTARLWDSGGNPLAVLAGERILHATFSPDGSRIATIAEESKDHTARLWDTEWKEIAVLTGHTSPVRSVAFSPDRRRIVTGSLDHTARLWDSKGKPLAVLEGHTAAVRLVVFSPDGSYVLTASDDRMGRLWNSEGELLGVLAGYEGRLSHAVFNADGSRIVATSEDGTARIFPVRSKLVPGRYGLDTLALLRFEQGHIPNRMYNSAVRSILEDKSGHYWFGTRMDGVCRFDGESLTYFTVKDGLSHNQVFRIQEDRKGVVWFETQRGINSYHGERIITDTKRNYTSKDDWRLETGDLWFNQDHSAGVNEREWEPGLYRYDGEQLTFLAVSFPEDRDTDGDNMFTGIAKGKDGRLWFATWESVIGYDGESFTIIDDQSVGLDEATGFLHVKCGLEDSKGRLWIGNNGIGVLLHDGDKTVNFTQKYGVGRRDPRHSGGKMVPQPGDAPKGAPSLHRVFSIGEDHAGNIWFGTSEQGAWRYDGKSLRNFTEKDGLATKGVMAIYTDRRGDLWLGGKGVYKFNGESFDRIH